MGNGNLDNGWHGQKRSVAMRNGEWRMLTQEGYRKLCKRYDCEGNAHYLTFSCYKNRPFLANDRTRQWQLTSIRRAQEKHLFDLWAWVIMPEHVHMLVLPHTSVSAILTAVKAPVAKSASLWVRANAVDFLPRMLNIQPNGKRVIRFWQRGGGYDRNITSAKELLEKIRYIHLNPVRRDLVGLPEDWQWSSSKAWQDNVDEPLKIDKESFQV